MLARSVAVVVFQRSYGRSSVVHRASRPLVSLLGADPATPGAFEDMRRHPEAVPVPGALIARPDAPLFYANAQLVREAIEHAVASSPAPVRAVVLVLDANDNLGITSAEQLGKLIDKLHAENVALGIAHMHGPALQMAQRSGLLAEIGPGRRWRRAAAPLAPRLILIHGQIRQWGHVWGLPNAF